MTTTPPTPPISQLDGFVFAAQACSCNCDPCVCNNNCSCQGADAYLGPRWRFVGDKINAGTLEGVDVSHRLLFNLAQTSSEKADDWHEVILIDEEATPEQVNVLLKAFAASQGSRIADPHHPPVAERSVYLVPIHYFALEGRHILSVTFSEDRSQQVRGDRQTPFFKEWTYNGHVVIREPLEQWGASELLAIKQG